MSLNSLPNELVIECLQYLGFKALVAFAQTCKSYNNVVKDSTTLQCIVELAASGCIAAPGTRLSRDLLERVRRHTEAWRTLSFTSQKHVLTSFAQYHGSVCCQVEYNREKSKSIMTFYQAPAVHRGIPEKKWKLKWTCSGYTEQGAVVFDPARDLLIIIEVDNIEDSYAHMLSLKTGLPHDSFGPDPIVPLGQYHDAIRLVDNILAVENPGDGPTLLDLCTQTAIPVPSFPLSPTAPGMLISPGIFLEAEKDRQGISLVVTRSTSDPKLACVQCSLEFPKFHEPYGFHIGYFTPLSSTSSGTPGAHAFLDDPAEQIIHLRFHIPQVRTVRLSQRRSGPSFIDIYILVKALLLHLPQIGCPRAWNTLSWDEWCGGDNCVIVESTADRSERGICDDSVYGARAVRLSLLEDPRALRALEVLDFHPRRVARANQAEVVREAILPGCYLQDDLPLVTRLPFTMARYALPEHLAGNGRAVISENAIVYYPMLLNGTIDTTREITMFCI